MATHHQVVPPACWPLQPAPTSCRYDTAPLVFAKLLHHWINPQQQASWTRYYMTCLGGGGEPQLEGAVLVKGGKWKLLDSIADQLPPLVRQLVWWPGVKTFEHEHEGFFVSLSASSISSRSSSSFSTSSSSFATTCCCCIWLLFPLDDSLKKENPLSTWGVWSHHHF